MPDKKFVLFDFDGVIADSYAQAYEASRHLCPSMSDDEHRRLFEGNINTTHAARLAAKPHGPDCRHDADFFEVYEPLFVQSVTSFPGIRDAVERLSQEYTLIIISSTVTSPIEDFIRRQDMSGFFAEVMGNDVHKSKVEKMRMVFEKFGTSARSCVFVTDTLGDIREAAHHTVGSIAVSWGFHTRETLQKGVPYRIVDSPQELRDAVADYFGR